MDVLTQTDVCGYRDTRRKHTPCCDPRVWREKDVIVNECEKLRTSTCE